MADEYLQSWIYWQFKGYGDFTTQSDTGEGLWFSNGTVQTNKLFILSRTYAQAVAGRYINQSFDPVTGNFSLTFAADLALAQSNATTAIYLNEKMTYTSGYRVSIFPVGSAEYTSSHNKVSVTAKSGVIKNNQHITVEISRKEMGL